MSVTRLHLSPYGPVDVILDGRALSLAPGASLEGLPAEVVAAAQAHWTPEVLADWAARTASPPRDITAEAREECRRRIFAAVPLEVQMNLAHLNHTLTGADLATYTAGLQWIAAMRAAWRTMEAGGVDPYLDSSWPAAPAGLADLVGRF